MDSVFVFDIIYYLVASQGRHFPVENVEGINLAKNLKLNCTSFYLIINFLETSIFTLTFFNQCYNKKVIYPLASLKNGRRDGMRYLINCPLIDSLFLGFCQFLKLDFFFIIRSTGCYVGSDIWVSIWSLNVSNSICKLNWHRMAATVTS